MQTFVDLIIPVYNRAGNIPNLIRELEKQTMRQFRAIFVDDGSTDDSVAVLKDCLQSATFPYEIVCKENGGAASARNAGLRTATAPWIGFVDSDDGLLPQFLEYLYAAASRTGADFSVCTFQLIMEGSGKQAEPVETLDFETIPASAYMHRYYTDWIGAVCMLINREFQQANNLYFDEQCCYHEDIPFVTEVIEAAQTVASVKGALYLYYAHQGSLSRSPRIEKFLNGAESFERTVQRMRSRDSEAAEVFRSMACARYYIATLRKAAVQMPIKSYLQLAERVDFRQYRDQIHSLSTAQKLASYILLLSRRLFYYGIRILYQD